MQKTILAVLLLAGSFFIPQLSFAQTNSEGDMVNTCVQLTSTHLTKGYFDAQTNGEVSILQDFLIEKGLLSTSTGGPTGYYGNLTAVAVKAYQASKGISQVGTVGPMTKAAIARETGCGGSGNNSVTITNNGTNTNTTTTSVGNGTSYPSGSFEAQPRTIATGQSTTLVWNVQNAVSCEIRAEAPTTNSSQIPEYLFTESVPASGSKTYSPTRNTTYTLFCSSTSSGMKIVGQRTVWVNALTTTTTNTATASVVGFMATPRTITAGNSTVLTWNASATPLNLTSCEIVRLDGQSSLTESVPLNGSRTYSPIRTTTYTLNCKTATGTNYSSIETVTVNSQTSTTANTTTTTANTTTTTSSDTTQSGASIMPEIRYFVLDPSGPLVSGQITKVMWDTNNVLNGCTLKTNLTTSSGSSDLSAQGISLSSKGILNTTPLIGTSVYTLTCKTANGSGTGYNSVSREATITVTGNSATTGTAPITSSAMSFTASTHTLTPGNSVALSWNASNNTLGISTCSIHSSDGQSAAQTELVEAAPVNGYKTYSPIVTTSYWLSCYTSGGINYISNKETVTVNSTTATTAPAEPTFSASCSRQSSGTYSVALNWNPVTGASSYPLRLTSPTGDTTVIGVPPDNYWNGTTVPSAPTGTSYVFSNLSTAGTYTYWGQAWNSAGWSSYTQKSVMCQ